MGWTGSGPGSRQQANHGSPPSFWCSTWSDWPGQHCCAWVFQHGKALKNRLYHILKQSWVYMKFRTALTSKSGRFLMSFIAEFFSRPYLLKSVKYKELYSQKPPEHIVCCLKMSHIIFL